MEKQILEKIQQANKIIITAHKSADGDSVGSSTAMYHLCKALNKNAVICLPDEIPGNLKWVQSTDEIIYFENHPDLVKEHLLNCDLLFALDYNDSSRISVEMGQIFNESSAYKIMIDHHTYPADFVDLKYSFPEVSSTCELVYEVIDKAGFSSILNQNIATSIYLGMMTDTGSFRFPATTSRTHQIAAALLDTGIKHYEIHEKVFDVNSLDRIRMKSYTFGNKLEILGNEIAIISLTEEELNRFNYQKGDTEGFVNEVLSIDGIKIAAFFSEKDSIIKISFRSKGTNNQVNLLSKEYFHGGGHINAAGGRFNGQLEDAISLFKEKVYEYLDKE